MLLPQPFATEGCGYRTHEFKSYLFQSSKLLRSHFDALRTLTVTVPLQIIAAQAMQLFCNITASSSSPDRSTEPTQHTSSMVRAAVQGGIETSH